MRGIEIVVILYILIIIVPVWVSIIYDKRDPVKALSWIVVVTCVPILGFLIYLTFGQNYRKRKLFTRKQISDFELGSSVITKQLYEINSPLLNDGKNIPPLNRDIETLLLNNNHTPLSTNNAVDFYHTGEATFSQIINALKSAKVSIHLEYYIFKSDELGCRVADVLMERAKYGVEVRVIYDAVGSWGLSNSLINEMRASGVEIFPFMPVVFPLLTSKINYRNHRKIIVIDGAVGFTGGNNIADKYIKGTANFGKWRDTHLKVVGGAVASLQRIFVADWLFVSGKTLSDNNKYFKPVLCNHGNVTMQIASSGPDSDWASIMQAFFAAITRASEYIYIATPYFTPNQSILTAIKVAALSGMDVKLIIPSRSDSKVVYWGTRSYITELLRAGVDVRLYYGGFIHSKVIIADGEFCSVGSANMDVRSFEDNFEVTAFIYDKEMCRELEDKFNEDLGSSRKLYLRSWLRRKKRHRFYEAVSRLLTPLL